MSKYAILYFLLFSINCITSQIKPHEKKTSNQEFADTSKINKLNKISKQYYFDGLTDKIIPTANAALILAQKIDYKKGICDAYYNIGIAKKMYGKNQEALTYFNKVLGISKEIADKKREADALNIIGLIYESQDDYKNAFKMFFQSLKIREDINDLKGIANSYNCIAIIFANQSNYSKALEYYNKALKLNQQLSDKDKISEIYNNIGVVYLNQKKIDSAISMHHKYLKIEQKNKNKNGYALAYNNLGLCYQISNKVDSALYYHRKSLVINEELKNNKGTALAAYNVGNDYLTLNQIDTAEYFANLSLKISKESSNLYIQLSAYTLLGKIYVKKQDFKKALEYQILKTNISDSIYSIASQNNIAELITKYETEKKESKIKILSNENEIKSFKIKEQANQLYNNRVLLTLLSVLILLIVLISWLLTSQNKIKQKNLLKTELLKQQVLQTEVVIETQENERKRIAQDLHDGIGQMLASIKINLISLTNNSGFVTESDDNKFKKIITSLDDAYKEVRTLSHKMMPKSLIEVGLTGAMNDLLEKTMVPLSINYTFEKSNIVRLDENIEIGIYRIFQELLNNIIKHANASEIAIHLHKTNTHTILIVEDNGIGIVKESGEKGIGLTNIEARANILKGTFSINPGEINGTVAIIRIPNIIHSSGTN